MRTRTTQKKREREQARRDRVVEKAARRAERRRLDAPPSGGDLDLVATLVEPEPS